MDNIEHRRQKNINDIITIVKLTSLFFCAIIFCSNFLAKDEGITIGRNGYFNSLAFLMISAVTVGVYWLWSLFSINRMVYECNKKIAIVENFIFISIFSILIVKSDAHLSQYKFLFLFIIITSTLQLGMKYGMLMAVVSSVIILAIDLIYANNRPVNMYFQNDLILVGVFILTAWPLGYYVKIENENIKRKNQQLKELNKELNKKDRQRKYMEGVLLKNEACYNLLIQNSRDAIFVHRDYKLIFSNEGAARLIGFINAEELIGKSILDFIPNDEKDSMKQKLLKVYDEKATMLTFEDKIEKNNGEIAVVQNTSTYFIYEGKPTTLSIFRDITPEKQVEKLQKDVEKNIELLKETREFNKFITEFFSNISHELKTPLNVIFAAVQVLSLYNNTGEEFKDKQDKYLDVMRQNCYRLMRLINNLLDITRADSGFLKLNAQNYNIVSVIEDITLSVASYVEDKGISLIFDTNVEEKVMAFDPYKIERIILNLLSNAIKFTNPGGEIYVNIIDRESIVTISVKDTGVGIPEDKLQEIFERFGQVDKTLSRNREGSGIGLSLVKSFVEMHGGKIHAKSKLGEGSEFIIELPAVVLEENEDESFTHETNTERINIEFSDIYK
ncbi:PAS domain-containing sensor histidine kinase [Clostridium sp. OS1-26]|uniref:PAS domain-containing sensor histidine kinase n=1 Tax=Clostridium sp. OS1-26 TaxID=3070681 RepID=UPI0027E0EEC9|nr:PAS domain-containing sensor histidine kinase [Clostridium sp. OS1-26]WML36701.1 PAS domain-containing sensor histidine kinase [Clostridium sp. OS1-26]